MKKFFTFFAFALTSIGYTQTPCENGMANGFPCNQISLQSQVTATQLQGTFVNDIWGWTDSETGKEYALVGLSDGVTFVDVTSPTSPLVIGKLIETHDHAREEEIQHGESSWRDIKVYKDHAFIVSDLNEEHGMQIFDLTQLRNFNGSIVQEFTQTGRYTGIGSAHNMVINEETGFGYIVGISSGSGPCTDGGLHIIDLNDPVNPQYVACFDDDGYTHDAQCVIYNGSDEDYEGMEICFNSNEDTFTIVNVNEKSNIQQVSRTSYKDAGYTHQGWLSEDHNYFFANDEFDEGNHGYNARTIIWDVRDLDNPIHLGDFYNEANSIDHNLYTHNGLIYESNYSSGLRVLEYSRVADAQLREVAFFDTQPQSDVIAFEGSWSNYPYFESGNIIVSDMANGLFILRLNMNDPIISHPETVMGCENSTHSFSVDTNDTDLTFQWQILEGTSFVDLVDEESTSGTQSPTLSIDLTEGKVRAKIEDSNGSIYYSYPANMELTNTLPEVDFSIISDENTIFCTNNTINAESYLWDFGDGNTSTDLNPTYSYQDYGEYTVSLTATNNCGETKGEKLISYVLSTAVEQKINIYPNPTHSTILIDGLRDATFQLHAITGKLMLDGIISYHTNSIDISHLERGVYFLTLEIAGKKLSKKISIN